MLVCSQSFLCIIIFFAPWTALWATICDETKPRQTKKNHDWLKIGLTTRYNNNLRLATTNWKLRPSLTMHLCIYKCNFVYMRGTTLEKCVNSKSPIPLVWFVVLFISCNKAKKTFRMVHKSWMFLFLVCYYQLSVWFLKYRSNPHRIASHCIYQNLINWTTKNFNFYWKLKEISIYFKLFHLMWNVCLLMFMLCLYIYSCVCTSACVQYIFVCPIQN